MITLRSSFVIGPNCDGRRPNQGPFNNPCTPFLIRKDVTASPTPTSESLFPSKIWGCRDRSLHQSQCLLILGRIRAQRMLDAIAQLTQNIVGDVSWVCVTKYTPTPFDRIRRATCSTLSINAFGASSNNKCASSKKKTSFGLSGSPTSGKVSKSSDNNHNKKDAYRRCH